MYRQKCRRRTGSASHQASPNKAAGKQAVHSGLLGGPGGALYLQRPTELPLGITPPPKYSAQGLVQSIPRSLGAQMSMPELPGTTASVPECRGLTWAREVI